MRHNKSSLPISSMFALLTGATGGIGQALAMGLAKQGADLVLTGRNASKLEQLKEWIKQQSPDSQIVCIVADLTNEQGIAHLMSTISSTQLPINVLINNAGISEFSEFGHQTTDDIARQLNINLRSPIELTQRCLPLLSEQESALIVNVGSTFGSIGYPGYSLYCASKFGLRGFSEALSRELGDSHVNVVYVAPRATQTEINSSTVNLLNQELGNEVDTPDYVAQKIMDAMRRQRTQTFLGWPEKLFVIVNGLFPAVVTQAISKQLSTIKRYMNVSGRA